jgi:D-alanine--D-alanine ligase
MKKLRIGVLMGGRSLEREVSLNSGRTVCDHLDTGRYTVIPLFQTQEGILYFLPLRFLHRGKISDFEHRLSTEAQRLTWEELKESADCLYIALHGRFGEDGRLQGLLEVLGIPYVGSKVMASALGMDKTMQRVFLRTAGIATPRSTTLQPHQLSEIMRTNKVTSLLDGFSFPLIIKPNNEGSSLGISKVTRQEDMVPALYQAATCHQDIVQPVIIEEYIEGMEFSCIILSDNSGNFLPLPPTEIVPEQASDFFDYEQKYMPGRAMKYTPARCSDEDILRIQTVCCTVMKTLGITNIGRIDGFLKYDGTIIITDPNTFAGMSPSSFVFVQAAQLGMSHTQVINHLIETELRSYGLITSSSTESKQPSMNQQKLRVAVLMGGRSNEKEISLESGRNITYKLSPHTYEAIPLFVDSNLQLYRITQALLVRNSTKEIEDALDPSMKIAWSNLPTLVDFVFIGLHGGEGENGCIQGTLEMLSLPYNGSSVLASALCMDKHKTIMALKEFGFDVPRGVLITHEQWRTKDYILPAPFPLIVKPHDDGCSVMVQKVTTPDELAIAVGTIFAHNKTHVLIEEFVHGMELTIGVIGNEHPQALPPSKTVAYQGILSIQEKFLPGAGENQTPAPLSQQTLVTIKKVMEEAYQALGCKGYARIDFFYQTGDMSPTNKERIIILEVNTLPGMTPATCIFHQAAEIGMNPMQFIDRLIQLGLEEHAPKVLPHSSTSERFTNECFASKCSVNEHSTGGGSTNECSTGEHTL